MNKGNIEHNRHTLAHLLGAAMLELYPGSKLTLGPAIDNGFYYDVDVAGKITDVDLATIEQKMRELLPTWTDMIGRDVSYDEAAALFAGNEYKIELMDEHRDAGLTAYTTGSFTDLCRGGHTEHPAMELKDMGWKLDRIAGAYWRGDEKNKMLTRVYGLAFESQEKLDEYLAMQEEAKKRDHRKIGKELDLFTFSDLVGSGMPLFTPKGNIVRNEIVNFSRELNRELGFGEVHTPNINKGELFKISGHYDKYKEDMLQVRSQYVKDEMFLKPMNCPQHTQIYASQLRSYRDLPIRYSDFAVLYRDERPGEMSGLTRLRAFAQDDGHIFCREDQIEEEIENVLSAIEKALHTYGISYWMRLSLRDPNNKEKYLGSDDVWEKSEPIMRSLLQKKNIPFKEAEGEAAFYGPKIDIMAVDAIGREWQISTIQLDFNMPGRFELGYTAQDGSRATPVMIHRALIGSPDRFLGILIEHFAGNFPTWLSPVQVAIVPVRDTHEAAAREIEAKLLAINIRVEYHDATENLGKRIRKIKDMKVPYTIILGDKDIDAGMITVEKRGEEKGSQMSLDVYIEKITKDIKDKNLS